MNFSDSGKVFSTTVGPFHSAWLPSEDCPMKADYKTEKCRCAAKHLMDDGRGFELKVCGNHKKTLVSLGWKEISKGTFHE